MNSLPRFSLGLIVLACVSPLHAQSKPVIPEAHLTFTTVDVPGAGVTGVYGINTAGDVVGYYGVTNDAPDKHGFLLTSGNFNYIDYPAAYATFAFGINDSGVVVGSAQFNGGTTTRGFTFDGAAFTTIRIKGKSATVTYGIDNGGDVVGGAGTIFTTKGFEFSNGRLKAIHFPGQYIYAYATKINNLGEIVGWTDDGGYTYSHGQFHAIAVPGASQTEAWGINDSGIVVGWYEKGPPYAFHSFASKNGKYLSLNFPGALETFALAISASGQIVGQYQLSDKTYHGFVNSPLAAADFR